SVRLQANNLQFFPIPNAAGAEKFVKPFGYEFRRLLNDAAQANVDRSEPPVRTPGRGWFEGAQECRILPKQSEDAVIDEYSVPVAPLEGKRALAHKAVGRLCVARGKRPEDVKDPGTFVDVVAFTMPKEGNACMHAEEPAKLRGVVERQSSRHATANPAFVQVGDIREQNEGPQLIRREVRVVRRCIRERFRVVEARSLLNEF